MESGLAAGTHTVTITDGIGCTGTATVTISSPPPVTPPSVSTSTSSVCQGNTNPVTLSITGGGSGSFNQTLSAACSFTTGGTVNLQYTGLPPNPTGNGTLTVFYRGDLSSTTETIGYSLDGTFIGSSLGTGGSDCQALYTSRTFTISNSQLTSMVADGTINILADATSGVNNFCYSNNTSFCTYTTLTYNYVNSTSAYWFAGSCSQNVSSAIGTGSSVNVTPTTTTTYYAANLDNGCWSVCDSVTVTVNPLPTVSASVTTSTICQGTSTTLTATGASSYSWSPTNGLSSNIGATVTASPSTTTTYTVTGTDANGCSNTATVQVIVSPAPNIVNILPTQPSCATGSDGSAVVTAFGTGTLTYAWSNGATTASNTGLAAGVYTVTVTDAVGCTSTQTTIVNAPAGVSANFSSVNATCATTSDGLASVFGTSGAGGPFTYLWPSGNTNQTESGLSAGTHTVTITDGNGCTGTAAVTISAPAPLATPSITATNTTLCQGSTTSTTLSAVGGVGTGTYTQTKSISCSSITGGTLNFTFTGTPTGAVNNATLTVFYRGDLASSGEVISYSLDGTFVGSSLPTGSPDCQTTYSSRVFTLSASQINSMASNGSISMLADAATSVNNFCYGSNTSFCTYATLTYNYSNNTGLYWFANSCAMSTTAAIGSNAPITVSPTTTTTYYAALYDGSCWGFCDSITINVGTPPEVSATASPSFVCNGASATLTASGASTYAWSPSFGLSSTSGSTVTASPTVSFTYTVVGTDANGCTSSTTVPVTVLSGPSVSINPSSVSCAGGNDGSATSNVSGGLTPYSYNWSNGSSNSSVSGLSAGSISVTVTDGNGCTNTASATIFQPSALSLSVSTSAASCFTSTDGSGSAFGSGGTFPYTYSWSNGSTGQTVNNLPSGSVTVTVTDGNGCTTSSTGFVGAPPAIGAPGGITSSNGNSFCSNGSTATLLTVPGGSGVQTFTFTTGTACSFTTGGNLNFNIPNTPTNASGSGVLRVYYDGDIGQASEVITYSADGTTLGTSNLSPSGDCPTVFYFKDFTVSATQLNSWASNGSINVFGDGATSINNICIGGRSWCGYVELTYPYIGGATTYWFANSCSYNVSASVGSGDSLNVAPTTTTTYYAATFDGTCWSLCDSLTINVNPTPTIGVTSTAAICPGVSATLTATGASTYVWSPVTGLNTGTGSTVTAAPTTTTTYTVTGTDANGCTASASTTVTVNPGVTVSASSPTFGSGNNISCFGANDGSVNLSITSGASPYTFAWTGPGSFSSTSQNITGLATGSYQVTVTDANGCIDNTSITLTGPSGALTASASSSLQAGGFNLSCNGGSDGSITLAVSGGSPTYTYNWSGPSSFSATVPNPGNLSAGAYSVTVTDLAGCSTTTSISLTEPTTVSATVTPVVQSNGFNLSCANSSDGDITANASGGLSPYTYGWSGPGAYTGSGANITGLVVGTYSLTVTDANGCTYTDSQVLTAPTGVTTSITSPTFTGGFNISCAGNTDGSATVSASGGAGNYTFNWSGPGGFTATGASINNLAAGLYILTTTDGAGCQFTDSITLTEPVVLQAGLSSVDVTCVGGNDGSIAATPTGGNGPFTFNWSHDGTLTGSTAGNLTEGTYLITVTDANGCVANDSITIGFINNLPVVNLGNDTNICDGATLTLNPGSFVSYSWSGGTSNPTLDVTTTGFYSVTVTDNNTCSNTDTIAVFVNSNPVVNLGNDTSVCGSLTLDAGSGYSSYLWNDNSTASTLNAASGGTYTVTVSDGNGCTGSSSINVTISPAAAVNVTTVDASCGNTDGEATAAPAAGNGPYTYNWSNGGTSASISGLAAGTYLITLTTADGCTTVGTGSVNNSGAPSLSIIGSDVSCAGAADGSASVTPTGGATPYAFQWNSGQTSGAISNLSGGTYIVNVTDANGCVASASFVVNEPTPLVASGSSTLASCGQSNGSATVVVSGGIAPLTYLWDDPTAQNMNPAVNLNAGLYTVTVTDAGGCSIVTSIGVNNANAATLSVLGNNTTCADDTDGSAVVSVAGGLSPFTYLWDDAAGQTTPTASNLGVGTYNVVVTDSSGCVSTASVNITASNPAPIVDLGGPFAVICENSTYDIDAGSAFQTYLWSDGSTNQILSVSTPGTYTVTVTDFNGCEGIGELTLVTDPCVSVATLSDPFSLNYFPNPTSGELNIAIKGWTGKDLHLQVFNLQGQVVYAMRQDQMPANFQYQIDLSSEAQGIYLLRVSNGETIETRKVSIK
ncbi:MAG: T9SS type A sorting domain-containing protein [Salibacteraceae bacterium]